MDFKSNNCSKQVSGSLNNTQKPWQMESKNLSTTDLKISDQ